MVALITDVVIVDAGESTGTEQVIALALGGAAPVFVSIKAYRTEHDDDSGSGASTGLDVGASASWGCTDGTSEWAQAASSADGATPNTITDHWLRSDRMVLLMDPADGTDDGSASFQEWEANEVTINWDTSPGGLYKLVVFAIAGTEMSAEVGNSRTNATINLTTTINHSLGVAPRGMVAAAGRNATAIDNGSAQVDAAFTLGYGSYDGTTIRQCSSSFWWGDNLTNARMAARASTDMLLAPTVYAAAPISHPSEPYAEITSVTSTTVVVTTRNVGGALHFGYAFIAGAECFAGIWDFPATTGVKNFDMPSGPDDVNPLGVLLTNTRIRIAEYDTDVTANRAGTMGWGAAGTDGASGTGCVTQRRTTIPTEAFSFHDDRPYHNWGHLGTNAIYGDWDNFDGDGWGVDAQVGFVTATVAFPQLLIGRFLMEPTGLGVGLGYGSPSLTLEVQPTGLAVAAALGSPSLTLELQPTGLGVSLGYGSPSFTMEIQPTGLAGAAVVGSPSLTLELQPDGLAVSLGYGGPSFTLEMQPDGLGVSAALGSPSLTLEIQPTGLGVALGYGAPSFTLELQPDGLVVAAVVGRPTFPAARRTASPRGQVVQGGAVVGIVTQSGMTIAQIVQSGPVQGQSVQSGSVAGQSVQSGAVAGQVVQSGTVAGQVSTST